MGAGRFAPNLVGQRFTRLLVIARAPNRPGAKSAWVCRCDCGTEKVISRLALFRTTKSCGCLGRELSSQRGKAKATDPMLRIQKWLDKRPNGCWIFTGLLDPYGYGLISSLGKRVYTHRLMYEREKGPINGLCVLHKCDVPACCNPDHLFLGTRRQNSEDKIEKNRHSRGVKASNAKLNDEKVRQMRIQYAAGVSQPKLSKQYGVSESVVSGIIQRIRWKHVV